MAFGMGNCCSQVTIIIKDAFLKLSVWISNILISTFQLSWLSIGGFNLTLFQLEEFMLVAVAAIAVVVVAVVAIAVVVVAAEPLHGRQTSLLLAEIGLQCICLPG